MSNKLDSDETDWPSFFSGCFCGGVSLAAMIAIVSWIFSHIVLLQWR